MASVYFGAGGGGGGGAQSQYIGVGGGAAKVGGGAPAPAGAPAGGVGATSAYIGVGAGGAAAPGAQSAYFAVNPTAAGSAPVAKTPREFSFSAVTPESSDQCYVPAMAGAPAAGRSTMTAVGAAPAAGGEQEHKCRT
ncbi:hypothetical protein ANCDUO_17537 [Ancylostoma duodenale]|uniref:Uncharacterized protein n=1 Tax=Ancylostoma duodenale TaxID=51022 RepID=A0A0C2CRC4_9BILA|nr:hypothetical protein ANCDUO_17537 [Ancylostoma duodenale]